jgi:hypothetical protein
VQPPSRDEVHVFVAKVVRHPAGQYYVYIPRDIVRALDLRPHGLVEVAIRVVDEEYARQVYGYTPTTRPMIRKPHSQDRVVCPICGKTGVISLLRPRGQVYIQHNLCDGFDRHVRHYISKRKHADWLEAHRYLIERRMSQASGATSSAFKQVSKPEGHQVVPKA